MLVTLYDELWSGVAVVAAPDVERFHGVDHAGYALWIFAAPLLVSSLIEAPIALLSDHRPRRWVLALGSGALAAALALCALATAPWLLACGLALAGAASGVTCAVAQGELVHTHPGGPQRAMSRWVAFAAVGDALVPLLVGATLGLGGTYREALGAVAALIGLSTWTNYRSASTRAAAESPPAGAAPITDAIETAAEHATTTPLSAAVRAAARPAGAPPIADSADAAAEEEPAPPVLAAMRAAAQPAAESPPGGAAAITDAADTGAEDAPALPPMAAVRAAARNPRLWLFLTASSLCALLDEIVIAFAALRLHADRGWAESAVATVMTVEATGAVFGALIIESLLARHSARSLMLGSALGSLCWLGLFIASDSTLTTILALFLLGTFAAPHYPLTKAAAYELVPGRPGVVNALTQLFVVVDILAPLAIGAIAASYGLAPALAVLGVQPVAVMIAALVHRNPREREMPTISHPADRAGERADATGAATEEY